MNNVKVVKMQVLQCVNKRLPLFKLGSLQLFVTLTKNKLSVLFVLVLNRPNALRKRDNILLVVFV